MKTLNLSKETQSPIHKIDFKAFSSDDSYKNSGKEVATVELVSQSGSMQTTTPLYLSKEEAKEMALNLLDFVSDEVGFSMKPIKTMRGSFKYRSGRSQRLKVFEIDVTERIDKMSPSDLELFIIGALNQTYPEKWGKVIKNSLFFDTEAETRYMADNGEIFENVSQRVIQC